MTDNFFDQEDIDAVVEKMCAEDIEEILDISDALESMLADPLARNRYAFAKSLIENGSFDETLDQSYLCGVVFGIYLCSRQDSVGIPD